MPENEFEEYLIEDEEKDEQKDETKEQRKATPYEQFTEKVDTIIKRIEKGEVSEFSAFNNEMKPTIKKGKSMLQLIRHQNIKRGDIVLITTPNGYTIKRVIKFVENGILLLGDHERKYTLIIDKTQILGKIVAKIERNKYISFNSVKQKRRGNRLVRFACFKTFGRIYNDILDKSKATVNAVETKNQDINIIDSNNSIDDLPDVNFTDEK